MNILIVEDDLVLASQIARIFSSYIIINHITIIPSPLDFVSHLGTIGGYDIILTDLVFSSFIAGIWGYRVIETIRKKNRDIPIIVMSGKVDIDILREAFNLGATDYLVKPFRLKELEVRVHHWFRNYCFPEMKYHTTQYTRNGLEYDIQKNEFFIYGNTLQLSRSQKYLFFLFFSNQGRLLSSYFLREKIWGDRDSSENRNLRIYSDSVTHGDCIIFQKQSRQYVESDIYLRYNYSRMYHSL